MRSLVATRAAPVFACHPGAGTGLVDEDEGGGIEVELGLEPVLALFQHVGAVLLGGVAGLFLRAIAWRAKKRHSVETASDTPSPASVARNSASVASGVAPSAERRVKSVPHGRRYGQSACRRPADAAPPC